MFSEIPGNGPRRVSGHDFASTSNRQQESELRNNETPGPSNSSVNGESTSGGGNDTRDEFNHSANGQNNVNLLVGDTCHKNRMLASSFDMFSKKQPWSPNAMERALDAWAKNGTEDEDRHTAKERILRFLEKPSGLLNLTNLQLKSLPEEIGDLTGLRELDLERNQLTALPDSIGNLTELEKLDLYGNQLMALPDSIGNLTGLSWLDLSNNQLTALPNCIGNLTELRQLYLPSNQLTELPDSIGDLTGLSQLCLWENQLTALPDSIGNLTELGELGLDRNQLTILPDFIGNLTGLRNLSLGRNQLTVLPDFIGNLTGLRNLSFDSNQLTALPDSISNLTELSRLDLRRNQLTTLPPSIFRLTDRTRINLEQNPLSPQTIAGIFQRTDGPRIGFSIVEAPAAPAPRRSRSFESAIRHYCSDIKPEHLQNLLGGENAEYFSQLLNRLDGTAGRIASAEASLPGFADRVAAVISTLAEVDSAELRANCYLQAQQGLETCADRVAITFSDIEIACKSQRILQSGGGHQQMAQLLRGLFRLNTLDAFARSDIASRRGGVDDIEVMLAYRIGLKDELALPCETGTMRYNAVSGVDQDALDRAKAHVLTAESADNGTALINFAIEQPFWNMHMEKNQRFQKKKQDVEDTFQKLGEELEERAGTMSDQKYTDEYNKLAASRNATLKNVQREYSCELLSQTVQANPRQSWDLSRIGHQIVDFFGGIFRSGSDATSRRSGASGSFQ